MKYLIPFLCLFLFIATATAAEVNINAETPIGAGSVAIFTLQPTVELSEDIRTTDIELKDNNSERIATPLTLVKRDNNMYYLGANLPTDIEERITITIEDLRYMTDTLQEAEVTQEFTLEETEQLHITQPIINLDVEAYENPKITFNIKNNAENATDIEAEVNANLLDPLLTITPGQTKTLELVMQLTQRQETNIFEILTIKDIQIPMFFTRSGVVELEENLTEVEEEPEEQESTIEFIEEARELNINLDQDQVIEGPVRIQNTGTETVSDLSIRLTDNLNKVVQATLDKDILEPNEITEIQVTVNKYKNIDGRYEGELEVLQDDVVLASFPIRVKLKEEIIQEEPEESTETIEPEPKKESKLKPFIPVIIILALVVIAALVFYKKQKPKQDQFRAYIKSVER